MNYRKKFEYREKQYLAPYAVHSAQSKGRVVKEPPDPSRTIFQRDRDRIIHSHAFRRLKHKTQVFISVEGDHYRTRLTHTLEVAQIARHIARLLELNEDLTETIALAHDLGHPPFGHAGEETLNELMQDYGGFEHNVQSKRIVEVLEHRYPHATGLNLSWEVLQGLMKHENNGEKELSLEAQVVNMADEIAYNHHDLDDGLTAGFLKLPALRKHLSAWGRAETYIRNKYAVIHPKELKTLVISRLIAQAIYDLVGNTRTQIRLLGIKSLKDVYACKQSVAIFSSGQLKRNREIKTYLYAHYYKHPQIAQATAKGSNVIEALYKYYDQHGLPENKLSTKLSRMERQRRICDYIAGMTDTYANDCYRKIS